MWKRAQHYNPGQNKMEQQTHIHHETARTLTCEYRCHFLLLVPQERGEKAVFAGYANAKTRHLPLFGRGRRGLNFPCFAQELVQVGKCGVSVTLCVPNISLCEAFQLMYCTNRIPRPRRPSSAEIQVPLDPNVMFLTRNPHLLRSA